MKHHLPLFQYLQVSVAFMILFSALPSQAFFRGGEITWECTPQGNFLFKMKLYRDCAGPGTFGDTLWIKSNFPGFDSIGMVRTAIHDITPLCDCPSGTALSCATATQTGSGALEEHIYTSQAFFSTGVPLTGVPPATGYYFAFEGCCRAPSDNIAPGNSNFAIRSVMFNYNNTPINTCFDYTPVFLESPVVITCSGNSNHYLPKMLDRELDSVTWTYARPLHNIDTPVTAYNAYYSFISPLPNQLHDSANIPASLNPQNGQLYFTSYTTGSYTIVIKVTAYKCGHKVAEVFREMPVIILPCSANNPPEISINGQPSIAFTDTVFPGTFISHIITATDTDTCQGSMPPGLQTVKLSTFGKQYASPMMSAPWLSPGSWSCLNPPCATLSPVIYYDSVLTGSPSVQTTFTWQTDCQHLATNDGCGVTTNVYNFYFTATDNYCPVPAKRTMLLRVVVIPKPLLPSPPVVCADVQPNGDVALSWHEPEDSLMVFDSYHLYASGQPAGPFMEVDSLFNIGQTSYLHQMAGAQMYPVYYRLNIRSQVSFGYHIFGNSYDTISTQFLQVTGFDTITGIVHLAWNALRASPLPGSIPEYTIHREYPVGNWTAIGSTTALTLSDTITPGNKLVRYKVSTTDTIFTSSGPVLCQSNSNIAELLVNVGIGEDALNSFTLYQNIPNPAAETTVIPFLLPESGEVTLIVHDITGRVLLHSTLKGNPGENRITADISGFASGIYSYTLHYRGAAQRKMMVVE